MMEWILIPIGFAVGAYGALVGAGGGFLLVPVLLFLYPTTSPAVITSISLAAVFFNAASATIAYARLGRIYYRTGLVFAAATVPGSIVGALTVGQLSRGLFVGLFGLMMILIAILILARPQSQGLPSTTPRAGLTRRTLTDASGNRYEYHFSMAKGIVISVGVGFLSSLLGLGGGIIHVPAMVLVLDFPTHVATATSNLILAIMALTGSLVHLLNGELRPGSGLFRSLFLAAGVVPGAQLGARLSNRVPGTILVRLLAIGLIAVGVRLIVAAFGQ
jgi:uncharacterized membrane protein YfcA